MGWGWYPDATEGFRCAGDAFSFVWSEDRRMDEVSLESFYTQNAWRRLRAYIIAERIARDGELACDYCHGQIVAPYDAICHHVIPLTEMNVNDPEIALNPENIQVLHMRCHNLVHGKTGNGRRAVYLVWGPPKAGKSWYVNSIRTRNDIVIDVAELYHALGSEVGSRKVAPVVFRLRDELYDVVRTRYGRWDNAYIVGTYPVEMDRVRLMDTMRAEEVFIDTDMGTCLSRCASEEEMEHVRKWFSESGKG